VIGGTRLAAPESGKRARKTPDDPVGVRVPAEPSNGLPRRRPPQLTAIRIWRFHPQLRHENENETLGLVVSISSRRLAATEPGAGVRICDRSREPHSRLPQCDPCALRRNAKGLSARAAALIRTMAGSCTEGHTIYRVASIGKWNLHPGSPAGLPNAAPRDPAEIDEPGTEELLVQSNRQKEVTRTVFEGSQAVSQKLGARSSENSSKASNSQNRTPVPRPRRRRPKRALDQLESQLRRRKSRNAFFRRWRPPFPTPYPAESVWVRIFPT